VPVGVGAHDDPRKQTDAVTAPQRTNKRFQNKKEEKTMEELIKLLNELHDDVDFEAEEALVDDGIIDSLDIVTLVTEINDRFDVSIPPEEIIPDNFNSAKALWTLICSLDE
jgi:acyl carrier protein